MGRQIAAESKPACLDLMQSEFATCSVGRDPAALADLLQLDFDERRFSDFSIADDKSWVLAIDRLIDGRRLEAAAAAATALCNRYPAAQYFVSVRNALERLPPTTGDVGFDAFIDDRALDVQIVPRAESRTTLLAFCAGQRLTLPVNLMHRWLGQIGVNVVYLRDTRTRLYLEGVASLAHDLPLTCDALKSLLAQLGTERLLCYGGSKGGFGCLLYAALLGAEAALAMGAPTDLRSFPNLLEVDERSRRHLDLREVYAACAAPPRAHLVYGALMMTDAQQAAHLGVHPSVSLEPVANLAEHAVAKDLVRTGRLEELLRGLVDPIARDALWSRPDAAAP